MVVIKRLCGRPIKSIGGVMDSKDEFKVVNPTYSNNGVVNTMFLLLPEMKGKTMDKRESCRHKDKIYIKLR